MHHLPLFTIMFKLVVDTNIVVSALLKPDSLPDLIINMILNKSFILCLSEDIFGEFRAYFMH